MRRHVTARHLQLRKVFRQGAANRVGLERSTHIAARRFQSSVQRLSLQPPSPLYALGMLADAELRPQTAATDQIQEGVCVHERGRGALTQRRDGSVPTRDVAHVLGGTENALHRQHKPMIRLLLEVTHQAVHHALGPIARKRRIVCWHRSLYGSDPPGAMLG